MDHYGCCDCPNEYSPYNCGCECHKLAAQEFNDDIAEEFLALAEKRYEFIFTEEEKMKLKETIPVSLMLEYIEAHKS